MPRPSPVKATWNAADYAANSAVQQGWASELLAKLPLRGDERILDVGCGDGKITAELARVATRGAVVGLDASPEMVRFARTSFPRTRLPNLKFKLADARAFRFREPFDLLFSNAALHWVDDHPAFLRCAAAALKPGGRLLVSCGGKGNAHDVFLALRPELRLARWRPYFRRMPMPYCFHAPADYEAWLPRFGFQTRQIQLAPKDTTYPGAAGFAAWLRTTWLPYTQRVPEPLRETFIAAVSARYLAQHPPGTDGQVHVRMMRLEIEAVRI